MTLPTSWVLALVFVAGILTGAVSVLALCLLFSAQEKRRKEERRRQTIEGAYTTALPDSIISRICPVHGSCPTDHVCDWCLPYHPEENDARQ